MHPSDDDSGSFLKSEITPRMTRSMQQNQLKECLPTEAKCANLKITQEGATSLSRSPKPSSKKKWEKKAILKQKYNGPIIFSAENLEKAC